MLFSAAAPSFALQTETKKTVTNDAVSELATQSVSEPIINPEDKEE